MLLSEAREDGSTQQDIFLLPHMKQCHKQHAECVKGLSMVEHLDVTSLRHFAKSRRTLRLPDRLASPRSVPPSGASV